VTSRIIRAFALAGLCCLGLAGCDPDEPATGGGPVEIRRLTESQYRQSIADIFGDDIKVAGRFEPDLRADGLLAVGTAQVTVTPSGFEQYDAMAHGIAAQIVDEKHRDKLIGCAPVAANGPDDGCADQFLRQTDLRLFRRPLTGDELAGEVAVAGAAARAQGDFYAGLEYGLAGLLAAPEFLFREETAEPDPAHPGQWRLDAYAMASRLSFLLWDAAPDAELLAAAERGELYDRAGLSVQLDRLLASPRLEKGVRAFFADMLGFDSFDALAKDALIYPKFSLKVANDAREQTLRTISDFLIVESGDYRELFTSRKTFLTRNLGMIYRVPVETKGGWEAQTLPAEDERAGLLTQISFLALHSHPGRSSATLRGKAIRELLLCEPVPMPPANVNFSVVQDTNNPHLRTARERLAAHRTDAVCAGCHKIMDPIGLGLETFDGAGQHRTRENGAPIDASGDLDGIPFKDAAGLGQAMHDDPATVACLVSNSYRFATGRRAEPDPKVMLRKSVLSAVAEHRAHFLRDLGAADKARLDQYFTSLRQLEQQLDLQLQKPPPAEACAVPKGPKDGPRGTEVGQAVANHAAMAELTAMALACNQTRVINMVFSDSASSLRKEGSSTTHHQLTHEEQVDPAVGYQPQATWFVEQSTAALGDFVRTLAAIREGDGTLLDNMLLFAHSDTQFAKTHSVDGIPVVLIGKAGGKIRTGLHIDGNGDPISRIGFTVQQIMGVPVDRWGTGSMQTSKSITELLV
jgi:hypothetical protein